MKKLFCSVIASTFFSTTAFAAVGEVVPCPEHKVGNGFEFKKTADNKTTSSTVVVGKIDPDTITVFNQARKKSVYDKMFNLIQNANGVTYSPKYYSRIECPFKLGETRKYEGFTFVSPQGANIQGNFVVTVDPEFSETEVPAGKFKTIRIISKFSYSTSWQGLNGSGFAEYITLYSPEVGHMVKFNVSDIYPNGRTLEEYVLFKLHAFPSSLFESVK